MGMEHHGMEHHGMSMGHHGMGGNPCMQMIWEKADDETKKNVRLRLLDEQIMHREDCIRQLQYKLETMKMIRASLEKM